MQLYSAERRPAVAIRLETNRPPEPEPPKKESMWGRLVNGIVRPPRSVYKETSLGSRSFILNQTRYERTDVQVRHQDKTLLVTVYEPQNRNSWLVLYLHGNSSSRLEATSIIKFLPFRYSLAAFDFIGCGHNLEADTISLGHREAQQVESVVNFLEAARFKVILWGRSMGAATALKYGRASAIVADSSFKSFRSLCKQVAKKNAPKYVPTCLVSCLFPCVFSKLRADVREKGDYDIQSLNIAESVTKISPSTLLVFLSGDEDSLIDKRNSEQLYNAFNGPHKHLEIFKGTHNTKRPEETIKKIMGLVAEHTQRFEKEGEALSRTKIDIDMRDED